MGQARLFSALLPAPAVVASLRKALEGVDGAGARWTQSTQWHVTLGFYGTVDVAARITWLRARLAGAVAPTVRLTGAGTFPGVLWTAVHGTGLDRLAEAVRPAEEDRPFRAHLTLARGGSPGALARAERALAEFESPPWTPAEVVLLRSDPGEDGPRYTPVERFDLGAPAT